MMIGRQTRMNSRAKSLIIILSGMFLLGLWLGRQVIIALGDQSEVVSYSVSEAAYPMHYLPAVLDLPAPTPTRPPTPIFLGEENLWEGEGYIRADATFQVGTHFSSKFDMMTSSDIIRSSNRYWYAPNPEGWPQENWFSYYSISSGRILSSSAVSDPAWKFGSPMLMRYDWNPIAGQPFTIAGVDFNVSGPFQGVTSFGIPVTYWRFENRNRFLYWDGGGDWKQYVHAGEEILHYDAGTTRLLLYENTLRRYYYKGDSTSFTVQYIDKLTESNAFRLATQVQKSPSTTEHFANGPVEPDFVQEHEQNSLNASTSETIEALPPFSGQQKPTLLIPFNPER